jgi:putative multiple sugar transport system substrate-binding protein
MTAFCPWEYEAAVAVDLALALLDGETVSQDWVEHAGFSFECSLGSRFVSGDLKNDTLFLSPLTVTADNLEQILCCYSGPF